MLASHLNQPHDFFGRHIVRDTKEKYIFFFFFCNKNLILLYLHQQFSYPQKTMLFDDNFVDTQNNQHIVFDDDCMVHVLVLILLEYETILANVNLDDERMVLSV